MRMNLSMTITCMVNTTAFTSIADYETDTTTSLDCPNNFRDVKTVTQAGYNVEQTCLPIIDYFVTFRATCCGVLRCNQFYLWPLFMALWSLSVSPVTWQTALDPKWYYSVERDDDIEDRNVSGATMDAVFMTMLAPTIANWSYGLYFTSRLIMGMGEVSTQVEWKWYFCFAGFHTSLS